MSQIRGAGAIMNEANANYGIGSEMSGVSAISYTPNSCGRREKFECSSRI